MRSQASPFEICGGYSGAGRIPVASRSKAWVCSRLFVGIVGSNAGGGIGVCLL